MHVDDDIPEVTEKSITGYERLMNVKRVVIYIHIYNFRLPDRRARNVNEARKKDGGSYHDHLVAPGWGTQVSQGG